MNKIQKPDLYHGAKKNKNFFEGWYFKIIDKNNLHKYAFIPGISLGQNLKEHYSFLQIVDGFNIDYRYLKFNKSEFSFDNKNFKISVDKNSFSLDEISLDLRYENYSIKGKLKFKNITKWKDSVLNPGSMGFYNYLKFMECYSQVCVLNGEIDGILEINGKKVDFSKGKVYIEKNWGRSFPESWIWIQSNNFKNKSVSITCSLATIPFPIKSFSGFLIGATIENTFFSFTTINKSKLNLKAMGKDIELEVYRKNLKLILKTYTNEKDFVLCMGPKDGTMVPLVRETLGGKVEMALINTSNNKVIFKDIGYSTGVEYGGDNINIKIQ